MRRLGLFALGAATLLLAPTLRAEDGVRVALPFGVRVRHAEPAAATAVEATFSFAANVSAEKISVAGYTVAALGSDAHELTGTFAYSLAYGIVLGENGDVTQGLALRGGVDLLVDSLGALKASHLSLPMLQVGYSYGKGGFQFDVGVHGAPVLAGRLRLEDSVRRMGFGAKAGPYLNLMLANVGLSAHLAADHLLASTTAGGGSDFARGLVCFSFGMIDACADGFWTRFAARSDTAARSAGYGGLSVGLNLIAVGASIDHFANR